MNQTSKNRVLEYNSLFLGTAMFLFGFLKVFEPFRTQFNVQITKSGLPRFSRPMGIAGEISIGLGLLSAAWLRRRSSNLSGPIGSAASAGLIGTMGGATYVHLHPEVPASVLPLKIKPPFIPLSVMFLAAVNLFQLYRGSKRQH